jgi:hypothetical protein
MDGWIRSCTSSLSKVIRMLKSTPNVERYSAVWCFSAASAVTAVEARRYSHLQADHGALLSVARDLGNELVDERHVGRGRIAGQDL